jgi:hypothetical protein
MEKGIFKSCVLGMATLALFAGASQADERIKALDRMMYTINPTAKIDGPQFHDAGPSLEKSAYVQQIVKAILKEADAMAGKYLEAGDTQAYYAFLTASLTVPLHEGLYIHFRNVDGRVCAQEANSGEMVKKVNETTYKIFAQYFKDPKMPFFPECSEIKNSTGVRQMIRGGDGTDLSIMQVSIRWHFDDFLANKKYESVARTLNYGFGHMLNGFDPVYRNISNYSCIYDRSLPKRRVNYVNLIKGTWAGKYNSGSIAQTCRFADPNSPFKNHDTNFAKNLDKILNFNGVIPVDFIGDIKVDGVTADAIKEIVRNLREYKNDRTALNKLIGR